ncbi:MAG: hypothetical protein H0W20_12945 [Chthoniobacterales bacterium]|nr:hypothetical protein [Chthoniobacterales bacterium]
MKSIPVISLISAAMLMTAFGQDPIPPAPAATAPALEASATPPTPPATPAAVASPTAQTSATVRDDRDDDEDLERQIERKVKRGLSITFGDDKDKDTVDRVVRRGRRDHDFDSNFDEGALMAIPIVGIIFTTLFGAPVLIVGVIMFFSFWKARSLHKTVRMMVEKGQPVPEALFAAPHTPARQRSDMRRGVILVMVGIGIMILFGALDDWDGGAWALGIIPFLIGAGYLAVWKLEGNKLTFNKGGTDNPPPLP